MKCGICTQVCHFVCHQNYYKLRISWNFGKDTSGSRPPFLGTYRPWKFKNMCKTGATLAINYAKLFNFHHRPPFCR